MIQTSEYEAFPQRDFIEGGRLRASITDSDPIVYSETAWGAPIFPALRCFWCSRVGP